MKKYKWILVLIIVFLIFLVYDNHFKPLKEAKENINKYMIEQGVLKKDISEITKEKTKEVKYKGVLYKVIYKDDSKYRYEYFYSDEIYALNKGDKVVLKIYDLNNKKYLKDDELSKVKYKPLNIDKKY